jgi:hypothetical protein
MFLVALTFGISSLFFKADIKVVAKEDTLPLKEVFEAKKNPQSNEFGYQIVTLENKVSKTVEGTVSSLDQKAFGLITIKNDTTETQKLIANTRFQSPNGLIYRIKEAVTIPKATKTGTKIDSGSIDVLVYADESGDKYNLDKNTSLSLPGLKNTDKYKTVYAVVKNPIAGGGSNGSKTVDENTKKTVNIELSAELKKNLLAQVATQVPEGFIYYTDSINYNFDDISESTSTGNMVNLEKKGSMEVIIFDKKLLSKTIIDKMKEKNSLDVSSEIVNIKELHFNLSKELQSKNFSSFDKISFELSGDLKIMSVFDEAHLKNDILGVEKKDLKNLLSAKYPGIAEFNAKIFPFWKTKIPTNPDKVIISKVTTIEK